jgi:hypothetical protein
MTVVEGWFAGTAYPQVPEASALGPHVLELLKWNCSMNNKAFLVDQVGIDPGTTDAEDSLLGGAWYAGSRGSEEADDPALLIAPLTPGACQKAS